MNHRTRRFFFRHYWAITPGVAILLAVAVVYVSQPDNVPGNLIALCAAALGVVYFVQKQKGEDLQLFERLFTQFNTRYATMHAPLMRVASGSLGDLADREVLDSYFNLCAEEYLFYTEGRILPGVWRAWCLGMVVLLRQPRVAAYWAAEQQIDSHYGLTTAVIEAGAGTRI